jgi:hypothetical protein
VEEEWRCGSTVSSAISDLSWHTKLRFELGTYHSETGLPRRECGNNKVWPSASGLQKEVNDRPQAMRCLIHYALPDMRGGILTEKEQIVWLPLTVGAGDPVKVTRDERMRKGVEAALRVDRCEWVNFPEDKCLLNVVIECAPTSTAMGYEVAFTDGRREWGNEPLAFVASNRFLQHVGFCVEMDDFEAQTMNVILRPATRAAVDTIDIDEIWGGEVVITGVKVPPRPKAR